MSDVRGEPVLVDRYAEATLRDFVTRFMRALGADHDEAVTISDGLVTAALLWHPGQGQGLEKLIRFHRRVRNGGEIPQAPMRWLAERPATALLDAAKGFGHVAAQRAMRRAIEKARDTGVAWVGVRDSNHFGVAGFHALTAAREGLIGIAMTNAGAEMAPHGSAKAVLGTNPWGIAVPRRAAHPLLLDMALTTSGKGMMRWLLRSGLPMPDTWALTPDGRRTTEPAAAMDGALLPIGAFKGSGLSLITDVLAGVLTGALFGLSVFQDDTHYDVGHVMVALDPEAFLLREAFDARLEALLTEVKSAPPIDPQQPVRLPGEQEFERLEERRRHGIPIDRETVERLLPLTADLGIECPL